MKNYKLIIPKPCNEDWNTMSLIEKGKFCNSCSKKVIDFTKKSSIEIKQYLIENSEKKVCGHFYRNQLDNITIQLSETIFHQKLSFHKLFLLSLLLVMGTTLLSCETTTGKIQKIDKIEIIDSIIKTQNIIEVLKIPKDSLVKKEVTIIETTGEIELVTRKPFDINKIIEIEEEIEE